MTSKPKEIARSVVRALNLLTEVSATEVYRAQARRARDPRTGTVLRQIQAHQATHACEARARVRAPEALRKAAEAAAGATGTILGTVSALAGDRPALALAYGIEKLSELGYRANLMLLDEGGGEMSSEKRVLRRALEEEREHQNLIRDRLGF